MSFANGNNTVKISDDVLTSIIATATLEVEGVHCLNANLASEIIGKISKKNAHTGINIINNNSNLTIVINLSIKQNYKIIDVCQNVQNKVETAIKSMTGLNVEKININVVSVELDKTNKPN